MPLGGIRTHNLSRRAALDRAATVTGVYNNYSTKFLKVRPTYYWYLNFNLQGVSLFNPKFTVPLRFIFDIKLVTGLIPRNLEYF